MILLLQSFGAGLWTRIATMTDEEVQELLATKLEEECNAWARRQGLVGP